MFLQVPEPAVDDGAGCPAGLCSRRHQTSVHGIGNLWGRDKHHGAFGDGVDLHRVSMARVETCMDFGEYPRSDREALVKDHLGGRISPCKPDPRSWSVLVVVAVTTLSIRRGSRRWEP